MESQPKISFAIPVYRARLEDLRTCITSIRNQSIIHDIDYEILVVIDGKSDNVETLQSGLLDGDDIHVVVQEHAGEAVARNRAIHEARGKYLIFVDADDYLEPKAAEDMLRAATSHPQVVAVFANHSRVVGGYAKAIDYYKKIMTCTSESDILQHVLSVGTDQGTVWGKLFDVQYLVENKLVFKDSLVNGVDQEFMVRFALTKPRVVTIPSCAYAYRYNTDSVVRKYDPEYLRNVDKTISEIGEDLESVDSVDRDIYPLYICDRLLLCLMNDTFNRGAKFSILEKRKKFRELISKNTFANSLREADISDLDVSRRIVLRLCKYRCFFAVWMIVGARQIEKSVKQRSKKNQ
ncbi:glycosyltransferase, group 2 family protein [Bifidobacterium thermophilum]|uniref:Glycosyltransferase, group 2 family protein n=1 Tax=Bifidobacterium thermophilum TaxID=33905 RepID=A0A2N3QPE7_9BIFI|nr:glycosyltransferase family A protein [Bifidobacterium thermophilum]PKU93550.1 glycosyltransferase, group 2 family protein [Bifidobacterium thermophilum]